MTSPFLFFFLSFQQVVYHTLLSNLVIDMLNRRKEVMNQSISIDGEGKRGGTGYN